MKTDFLLQDMTAGGSITQRCILCHAPDDLTASIYLHTILHQFWSDQIFFMVKLTLAHPHIHCI